MIAEGCGERVVVDGSNIRQPADWKNYPSMIEIVRRPIIFIELVKRASAERLQWNIYLEEIYYMRTIIYIKYT